MEMAHYQGWNQEELLKAGKAEEDKTYMSVWALSVIQLADTNASC